MSEQPIKTPSKKEEVSGFVRALSEPLSKHGWPSWLVYLLGAIGVVYILNPTAGLLELIPDLTPIIGNLDESVAVMLILAGIVEALEGRKYRQSTTVTDSKPSDKKDIVKKD